MQKMNIVVEVDKKIFKTCSDEKFFIFDVISS